MSMRITSAECWTYRMISMFLVTRRPMTPVHRFGRAAPTACITMMQRGWAGSCAFLLCHSTGKTETARRNPGESVIRRD